MPTPTFRIAHAAAVLLGGFVVSRLVGFLRNVVIGAQFGTSPDYDLYVAAFQIPDTIFTLIAGGALSSALVPVFAERLAAGRRGAVSALAAVVFNCVVVAAGLAAALGILVAPQLVSLLYAGFDPSQHARLAVLLRIMLLQPVLLAASEVLSRFLNVHHHFIYPALAPAVYSLAIVLAAVVLGPPLGTLGLALGVTLGAAAYLLVQLPAARATGFRWRRSLDLSDPSLQRIASLMLPRMVGQGAVQLSLIFTTRLASFLPDGRIGALSYAFQLTMLPLSTFAMSVASAAFPTLSEQAARADRAAYESTVRRTISAIAFVLVPSAVALMVAGLPIVQTLFQRGQFGPESSVLTAAALSVYAAGLPAHGAIEILVRAFYALQDTRTPVAIAVVAMVANAVLAYVLVGPMGHVGIALALSASASAEAVLLTVALHRRHPGIISVALALSLGRTAAAAAALALVSFVALAAARRAGLHSLVEAAASLVLGGLAYLAVAYALRSPDLLSVLHLIHRRLQPRPAVAPPVPSPLPVGEG